MAKVPSNPRKKKRVTLTPVPPGFEELHYALGYDPLRTKQFDCSVSTVRGKALCDPKKRGITKPGEIGNLETKRGGRWGRSMIIGQGSAARRGNNADEEDDRKLSEERSFLDRSYQALPSRRILKA